MPITTLSSWEFSRDTSKAKRAAQTGPVFITDCGLPAYVLLSIENYQKMIDSQPDIIELLAMPDPDQIDFSPPRLDEAFYQLADLS